MSKKIKLTIQGVNYELPKSAVVFKGSSQWEDETYIQMRAKYCSSIIKQYVKKNFPLLNVWATSSVYSGGSSCDIYVSNQDGSSVDKDIYEQIENFSQLFKGGSFNGMEDIYEYRTDDPTTDNGTPMKYFPSYVFVNNKPKWGTVEYWMNEWNELKDHYKDKTEFLLKNKTYMTDKEYKNICNVLNPLGHLNGNSFPNLRDKNL